MQLNQIQNEGHQFEYSEDNMFDHHHNEQSASDEEKDHEVEEGYEV